MAVAELSEIKETWSVSQSTSHAGVATESGQLPEDLEDTWRRFKATRDEDLRNRLIEHHLPIVRFVAERLLKTLPRSVSLDDVLSAGWSGLMDAVEGFDLDRGIKFKTYCSFRIRGAILDELRQQDWVPRGVRRRASQVARVVETLGATLGRAPCEDEIATALGVSPQEARTMKLSARPIAFWSLSEGWDGSDSDSNPVRLQVDDPRADQGVREVEARDLLEAFGAGLSAKERTILTLYYGDQKTMRAIGERLDLTESRVCQIHGNIVARLREQHGTRQLELTA